VIATAQQYLLPPWTRFVSLQQQFLEHLVDQYLAVCEAVAHQLQRSFQVPARKIRVVHNSIPVNESPHPSVEVQRLRRTLAEGRHLVLTVARLDRQKGHTYLLKAIAQIPQAVFLFVGDGPERKKLQDQARHLGVDQRVVFLGFRQDVPSLLAGCDLFVLPSLYEGLPLSILEAMAAGKPVIATDVGGNAEAVLQGETGYLVPPGDPPAIASAIQRLLSDPALAVKFGQAGQARVRERFSVTSMVRCVEDTYEELLLKRRNHRS
jgi:glycosyltransferase involved in cell wall biosynthesis